MLLYGDSPLDGMDSIFSSVKNRGKLVVESLRYAFIWGVGVIIYHKWWNAKGSPTQRFCPESFWIWVQAVSSHI